MSASKSLKSSFDDLSPHVKIILPYILWVIEYYSKAPTKHWGSFINKFFPNKKGRLFWLNKDYLFVVPVDDDLLNLYNLNNALGRKTYYDHSSHAFNFLSEESIAKGWYNAKKSYLIHVDWDKIHKLKQLLGILEEPDDLGENYMNKKGDFYFNGQMINIDPKTQVYKYINLLQKADEKGIPIQEIHNKLKSKTKNIFDFGRYIRGNTKDILLEIMSKDDFKSIFIVEGSSHILKKRVVEEDD